MKKLFQIFFTTLFFLSITSFSFADVKYKKVVSTADIEEERFDKIYQAQLKNLEYLKETMKVQREEGKKTNDLLAALVASISQTTAYLKKISGTLDQTNQLLSLQIKENQRLMKIIADDPVGQNINTGVE